MVTETLLAMAIFETVTAFILPPRTWFIMNSILMSFLVVASLMGCASKGIPPRHITDAMNCKVNPEDCR